MATAGGGNIDLSAVALSTEWQPITAAIDCNVVIMSADQDWAWCTNTDGASWAIPKSQREPISTIPTWTGSRDYDRRVRHRQGETICFVKGFVSGTVWIKCER